MNHPNPNLVRAVQAVRERLLNLRRARWRLLSERLSGLLSCIDTLATTRRKLVLCVERGYDHAARHCMAGVDSALRSLSYQLQDAQRPPWHDPAPVPSLRDIFADLRQLQEEFGEVRYPHRDQTLSVVTEPITLEGVHFGPFEIVLHLESLTDAHHGATYEIVALEPNPAASNDDVTHPHVSGGGLCAGDGVAAIQAALASGRVCDFFVMVRSVLETYNPSSPYVRIEDWDGVSCYGCGHVMGADDAHWCSICENDFCEECAGYCARCDETTCNDCLEQCPACDESVCRSCMAECPDCGRALCRRCLENNECPCHEEEDDDDQPDREGEGLDGDEGEEGGEEAAATPGVAAVHADRVGQAAVPA